MLNINMILLVFALTALVGSFLLAQMLSNKNGDKAVAYGHGAGGVLALVLLMVYSFNHDPSPIISLIIFILAAIGGAMIFYKQYTGNKVPKWLAIGHGLTALTGLIFLMVFAFK